MVKFLEIIFIIIILLSPTSVRSQSAELYNIWKTDYNITQVEFEIFTQINFIRIKKKLKPLKINSTLNSFASQISSKLSTSLNDTTIPNTKFIYFNDSLILENQVLVDSVDLIGISKRPHKYKCELLVITFDKRLRQIVWKDIEECPKFMNEKRTKTKSKFKL